MSDRISRRDFVRGASGAAALGAGVSGTAAAQEGGGEEPDFGGWLSEAKGGSYEDLRGESEVTVEVGAGSSSLAFAPTGIWIDQGTTVNFEFVSSGHNVKVDSAPDGTSFTGTPGGQNNLIPEGETFSFTFETNGIYNVFCNPHLSLNMVGGIAVGEDVPTVSTGGGGGGNVPQVPNSAKTIGVATSIAMVATLGLAYFFLKYGGEFETPE
jgi:plastocyanin